MEDRKLAKLLEFASEGANGRRKMLSQPSFRRSVGEDIVKRIEEKNLLQTEALQEDTLIQEEVLKKLYEGAEPFKCMRDVLNTVHTKSSSLRVTIGESGGYAYDLAEGGDIPNIEQDYTHVDISIGKVGTGALVSNELVEDGLWDVVAMEIKKGGRRIENKLNRDALEALLGGMDSGNDLTPTSTGLTVADLAKGRGLIKSDMYMPTDVILHPIAEAQLLQDTNLLYVAYAGQNKTLETGQIPKVVGLTPHSLSVTTTGTQVWTGSAESANNFYGLILDPEEAAILAIRRDISIKNYDDVIHDLTGAFATMRYGVGIIHSDAGSRIKTETG